VTSDNLPSKNPDSLSIPLDKWLQEKEKQYLTQKLEDFGGNVGRTAKSCRIGVRTLSRKMRQYGLDKKLFKQKESATPSPHPCQVSASLG
jgi:DNA-binding NtrC family response regulator